MDLSSLFSIGCWVSAFEQPWDFHEPSGHKSSGVSHQDGAEIYSAKSHSAKFLNGRVLLTPLQRCTVPASFLQDEQLT